MVVATCSVRLWGDGDRVIGEVATPSSLSDAFAGRRRPDWDATTGAACG
jgi:hypothetical protein